MRKTFRDLRNNGAAVPAKTEPMPVVPVADLIAEDLPNEDEIKQIFKELGLIHLGPTAISQQKRLGVYLEGIGVLRHQTGGITIDQERLGKAVDILLQKMSSPKLKADVLANLAHQLAYATGKLTDSRKVLLELAKRGVRAANADPVNTDAPLQKSFVPRSIVQVNVQGGPGTKVNVAENPVAKEPATS